MPSGFPTDGCVAGRGAAAAQHRTAAAGGGVAQLRSHLAWSHEAVEDFGKNLVKVPQLD